MCAQLLSRVQLFVNPWAVARLAPLSMGFSRQEYWVGLPFPTPGDLPNRGIKPESPALAGEFFTTAPPGKPNIYIYYIYILYIYTYIYVFFEISCSFPSKHLLQFTIFCFSLCSFVECLREGGKEKGRGQRKVDMSYHERGRKKQPVENIEVLT